MLGNCNYDIIQYKPNSCKMDHLKSFSAIGCDVIRTLNMFNRLIICNENIFEVNNLTKNIQKLFRIKDFI